MGLAIAGPAPLKGSPDPRKWRIILLVDMDGYIMIYRILEYRMI